MSYPADRLPPSRAYSFQSDLGFESLRIALTGRTGLEWRGGDNDVWGDYLIARPGDGTSKIRVFADGDRWVVDVFHLSQLEGTMPYDEIQALIEHEILPAAGARDVQPHSGWE